MSKDLITDRRGVRGGRWVTEKLGEIDINFDDNRVISVDNYKGFDTTYEQRVEPIIAIFGNNKYDVIFEGTHQELVNILKSKK